MFFFSDILIMLLLYNIKIRDYECHNYNDILAFNQEKQFHTVTCRRGKPLKKGLARQTTDIVDNGNSSRQHDCYYY